MRNLKNLMFLCYTGSEGVRILFRVYETLNSLISELDDENKM